MCLVCGCDLPPRARRVIQLQDPAQATPDELVLLSVEDALSVAESWIGWNGIASLSAGSAWTPHKALRRITDHMVDHLTQIECRAAGETPPMDAWRGRAVTMESDWARFTEQDLDEATARLRRLAQVMAIRLRAVQGDWDADAGEEWTIRGIATHVAEATDSYSSRPVPTRVVGRQAEERIDGSVIPKP
jgi:hypothetical protein